MTALISNLMLRPDNIDKVIKAGGIKAILRGFGQFTDATKEASARALGRMANAPDNIRLLIQDGAIEVLAEAVKSGKDNEVGGYCYSVSNRIDIVHVLWCDFA
jgi:hypothetical protein